MHDKVLTASLIPVVTAKRNQAQTLTQAFVPPTPGSPGARIIQPAPPDESWIDVTFCRAFYFHFFSALNQLTQHCVFDLKSIKIVAFFPLISLKHFNVEKIFHFQHF